LTGRSFVVATYIKYDSLLRTSGALHLDIFEHPAKNDLFWQTARSRSGRDDILRVFTKGEEDMRIGSRIVFSMMALAAMAVLAVPTFAQDKPADNMQIVLEKVRADKKLLVAENMELTESEGKAFWPIYDRYQDELFLLRVRSAKLISDYANAFEKMTNENARSLLDEALVIESLGVMLRQVFLSEFRRVLPDVKVARYYQIENKIQAALLYELARNIPLAKAAK
jgi:hypothetical protein